MKGDHWRAEFRLEVQTGEQKTATEKREREEKRVKGKQHFNGSTPGFISEDSDSFL